MNWRREEGGAEHRGGHVEQAGSRTGVCEQDGQRVEGRRSGRRGSRTEDVSLVQQVDFPLEFLLTFVLLIQVAGQSGFIFNVCLNVF